MEPMTQRFTLDQANRMLPLVTRIVSDILGHYREWQHTVEAFEVAAALTRNARPTPEVEVLQRKAQELAREIQGFVAELVQLGVEFKGFELGLVDFPGEVDGRQVYWCWKHGEPAVDHWHDMDSGFSGRQPVAAIATPVTHPE
jgi:hypothetical protein